MATRLRAAAAAERLGALHDRAGLPRVPQGGLAAVVLVRIELELAVSGWSMARRVKVERFNNKLVKTIREKNNKMNLI